jgi:hypothetical protein
MPTGRAGGPLRPALLLQAESRPNNQILFSNIFQIIQLTEVDPNFEIR